MDYKRIYDQLIDRAKERILDGYVERHHILPKCMGGSDDRSNIAILTPEEHFVAHVLLVKIYPEVKDLIVAVSKMTSGRKGKLKKKHRKLYGWLRRKHAERMRELQSGKGNSQYGTMWIHQGTNNKRIRKGELVPVDWQLGRVVKPQDYQKKCKRCFTCNCEFVARMISSKYCSRACKINFRRVVSEETLSLLKDYESGLSINELKTKYNKGSEQAITTCLRRNFPNRRKFKPNERLKGH